MDLADLAGRTVLLTGFRVAARATVAPLLALGAQLVAADSQASAREHAQTLGLRAATPQEFESPDAFAGIALVVTSPGWRPESPVLQAAAAAGVPVWGDVELAWRIDQGGEFGPPREWLVVTGTNGKTTTTSMLETIVAAGGRTVIACGNIGLPILDALAMQPRRDVLAVELSSFQLFWAPSVRPAAGAVLNIAEDHLDWHGGMSGYIEAKRQALTGAVAVVGLDDPVASGLHGTGRTVGFRLGEPAPGELGIADGQLVDRAFGDPDGEVLGRADEIRPAGFAGQLDALAASALARAIGIAAADIGRGLREFTVGAHRGDVVCERGGVRFIDDSKATNPHAARAALLAHPRVVWVAGGQLKGAAVGELVAEVADRLAGAAVIGVDGPVIVEALRRHAPDVPRWAPESRDDASVSTLVPTVTQVTPDAGRADAVMAAAVAAAASMASPGDVVLLAPAAASLDMFTSYAERGESFAAAARALGAEPAGATQNDLGTA